MSTYHPTLPSAYTPVISNSGIATIYGGLVHEPVPHPYKFKPLDSAPDLEDKDTYIYFDVITFYYPLFNNIPIIPTTKETPAVREPSYPKLDKFYQTLYMYPPVEGYTNKPPNNTPPIDYSGFAYLGARDQLKQIYMYSNYMTIAYTSVVNVQNIKNGDVLSSRSIESVPTSVWCDKDEVYVGTKNGIYKTLWVNGNLYTFEKLNVTLSDTFVNDIKGYKEKLLLSTSYGIEYIDRHSLQHSSLPYNNISKVWVSNDTGFAIYKGTPNSVLLLKTFIPNLTIIKQYQTDGTIFKPNITINDIYVTNNTNTGVYDTLICATSVGIYLINIGTDDYNYIRMDNVNTIWSDPNTNIIKGIIYATLGNRTKIISFIYNHITTVDLPDNTNTIIDNVALHTTINS